MRELMVEDARRRRREFIRAHHPDRGGDPAFFIAGLQLFGEGPGSLNPEPLPRVVVIPHRSWPVRLVSVVAGRLHPVSRPPRVR